MAVILERLTTMAQSTIEPIDLELKSRNACKLLSVNARVVQWLMLHKMQTLAFMGWKVKVGVTYNA